MVKVLYFAYSHIWQNLCNNDHHFFYFLLMVTTSVTTKKIPKETLVVGSLCQNKLND
jgi:hypothetical protein